MKQFLAASFVIAILMVSFLISGCSFTAEKESDFLRLHIRANSNSLADQEVKYLVKQQIVDEMTPLFENVTSKQQAINLLADNIGNIESAANAVLASNGFLYKARAAIRSEHFPTRAYVGTDAEITLPEGIYDALVIELGQGTGDNWWCVVYPPLCFLDNNTGGNETVVYRSKILEWFKK